MKLPDLVARGVHAFVHAVFAPGWLRPLLRRPGGTRVRAITGRSRAIAVGLAIATPTLIVFGALLASADAVFASALRFDLINVEIDGANIGLSAVLIGIGAWTSLALLRVASSEPPPRLEGPGWRLGRVELTIVLVAVVALFGAFALAQVVALSNAGDRILRSAGVTYAAYARTGFFQLLWVACLTVAGLLSLRPAVDDEDPAAQRTFRRLALVTIALTLVIVAVALRRLALYENAYGLTMLRLYSSLFAVWIGAVLVLLAARIVGVGGRRSWLPAGAGACALGLLLVLNIVNPEAVVARHNLGRNTEVPIDVEYLFDLSDDAVPTLAAALPRLNPEMQATVRAQICQVGPLDFQGPAAWNLARSRAEDARRAVCSP